MVKFCYFFRKTFYLGYIIKIFKVMLVGFYFHLIDIQKYALVNQALDESPLK